MRPGLSGMPYGVDAVDQFQVVTSGGQAELGRALGGYVNVVTKSGTNALHGDLYGYFRDDRFNAPNALSGTTLPMHQQQYGASLGGPIVRDRTFYFANVEQRQLDQSGLIDDPAGERRGDQRAARGGRLSRARRSRPASIRTRCDSTNVLGKIDHQVSGSDQLSVRYSLYDVTSDNSRGAGGAERAERVGGPRQRRSDDRVQQHAERSRRGRSTRRARSSRTAT